MSSTLRDIVSLTKPRLSGLVIFTAGGGLVLAPGSIGAARVIGTLLATSLVVGSANAFNCYLERDLDQHMARTRTRPLPSGRLDPSVALWVGFILGLIALPALVYFANPLTAGLGLLGLLSYVLAYTPLKQRSALALWVGAVPGAIPPLMGWTAVRGKIELAGLVLAAVLFCWQIPHFIAIAIARREDYTRAGHKILPVVATDRATKLHALVWTLLLVIATLALAPLGVVGNLFDVTAMVLGAFFLSRVILGFVRPEGDLGWARKVFVGSLLYLTALFVMLAIDAK
ncbi:MAG: protoheme IX farnesyltransferase [Myxococcales bacterium]|nr:protoheme IX farnesyltransferase [Myxococcales bacterium]